MTSHFKTMSDIRKTFLSYFENNNHTLVPAAPLIPQNDPTLLFVNAGMVPFKNVFTGLENPGFTRAASSQKCVRAGGKHNDLENVGYTARHHTFFEMLGNFSFGDYFKEEAIELAWNLITKDFGIPKDRLWITVYKDDQEAATLWKKIAGLSENRIIPKDEKDNFWSMGDTGPCGPCSEIFYDHGDHVFGGPPGTPDEDGDRYVEIWNLVFMEFDQQLDDAGTPVRTPLPRPSIDTGMGLERITAVLQGVHNNYDTDHFRTLIQNAADIIKHPLEGDFINSYRVIADHLRASCFLMADGVMPSNEGRGYVLRRIMRRAMRHCHILKAKDPVITDMIGGLVTELGTTYPELVQAQPLMTEVMRLEEERFQKTLDRGLRLLDQETAKLEENQPLPGDIAFKLYDTYGFPVDLTQDALKAQSRDVDLDSFEKAMAKQKTLARASWESSGDKAQNKVWFDIYDQVGATEFLGYSADSAEAQVQALISLDHTPLEKVAADQSFYMVLNQTPCYAESGGQLGDKGVLLPVGSETPFQGEITDTVQRAGKIIAHRVTLTAGTIEVGDTVLIAIDSQRRNCLRANHSVTHLTHGVLRDLLGDHVVQKGSLVTPDRLRFDFSFPRALTAVEIKQIEEKVNSYIRQNTAVETHLMSPEEAKNKGAIALFGEKYDEQVRVVSMGQRANTEIFSTELCGGTHVRRTGDIGGFKIINEIGIAAGIRRIEALTGPGLEKYIHETEEALRDAATLLKVKPSDLVGRLEGLLKEKKELEQNLKSARKKAAFAKDSSLQSESPKTIKGVSFIHKNLQDVPAKDLKGLVDELKATSPQAIILLTNITEGRVSVVIGVSKDLTPKIDAVTLVREAAITLGGKGGGGRPDMAQGGGTNPQKIQDAVKAVEALAEKHL